MMKKAGNLILIFTLSFIFSRGWSQKATVLDGLWHRADTLIKTANQPRAALSLLDTITAIARKQHQRDELIKASVYRLSLLQSIQEEDPGRYILFADSLMKAAADPVEGSLLTVLKARLLIAMYNQDRFKIMRRTDIEGGEPDEARIAYWTTADYQIKIHELYAKALEPAALLQQSPNKNYDAIVNRGNTPTLRPTLYDLVMHDALAYYRSGMAAETTSGSGYVLNDTSMLADAAVFVKYNFTRPKASDSLNRNWIQLGYFRDLIAFHLNDKDRSALADLDLERLDWAYDVLTEQAGDQYKDEYRRALGSAITAYKNTDAALYGTFQLADTYAEDAGHFTAGEDTAHRYDYVKALHIIEQFRPRLDQEIEASAGTSNKNRVSQGAAGLLNLRNRILRPVINLEMESVNMPEEPMRALVKFSNVTRLYFRVLQVPVSMESPALTDSLWKVLVNRVPLKQFSQSLPATEDHQQHSVEIKIPALDKGGYLLLVSTSPAFPTDSTLAAVNFTVSRLAYVSQGTDMFFVDRKTGRPIDDVQVGFYDRTWKKNRYQYILHASMRTNDDGRATMRKQDDGNYSIMAVYDDDSLTSSASFYQPYRYSSGDEDREGQKSWLFYLDRSIYRPGQQVFFKGIATVMYQDVRGRKLLKDGGPHKIYLYDANSQKVDSLSLTLNDYGALSGSFTLPAGRLSGNYALGAEDFQGRQYFRVEEYKRPTYFVSFDALKAAIALGDSVTVKGQAMAYSGYPVAGANVDIVVTREVYFPYMWYRYVPRVATSPIAHGSVTTDDKGNFEFTFKAAEGEKSWNRLMPNYHFSVAATSTDQNGETRDARTLVIAGSQPFNLALSIPENTPGDLLDTIDLVSKTAAGHFTSQKVSLRITKLLAPQRLLRARLWQTPDLSVMDSASFVRDFPNDPYMDEANKDFWKRGDVVYSQQITTTSSGKIGLNKRIGPGWYEISAEAPGVNGQTIRDREYVYLYNAKNPLVTPQYNWSDPGQTEVLPGERSGITLASAAGDQYVIYVTTRMTGNSQTTRYGHSTVGQTPVLLPISLTKKEIHGANLNYVFVRDNRKYTGSLTIHLKDTTTRPEIIYESFRDKTEPGSKEHWSLHINKGKERLRDMELLSSMYDASLDQFTMHDWSLPKMYTEGPGFSTFWQTGQIFSTVNARSNNVFDAHYMAVKEYDGLIYDQLLGRVNHTIMLRGVRPALSGRVAGLAVSHSAPNAEMDEAVVAGYASQQSETSNKSLTGAVEVADELSSGQPLRSDFRETAFFFPQVHSDSEGNYTIDFQMPDALTTWNWMNLAYDGELNMVKSVQKIVTQKSLMVVPNLPRFVRNGDSWTLSAKVVNLTKEAIQSRVSLLIEDPVTGQQYQWGRGSDNTGKNVVVQANGNATVRFDIAQPADFTGPVNITLQAKGDEYSDAEKNIIPVLTNKMQVTETLPIYLRKDGEKTFTMDKLLYWTGDRKESKRLVLELTANPIWTVVTALPDIQIGEKPNGMDVLERLYANAMGAYVMRTYPAIAKVIQQWSSDTIAENKDALTSTLEKNPALKSVLLEQTPWVMDAHSETAQHKALLRFFNSQALDSSQRLLVSRLLSLQDDNGGFSWFSGGRTDIISTQNILTGIHQLLGGKLKDPSLEIPLTKIAGEAVRHLAEYYTTAYEQWQTKQLQTADVGSGTKQDTTYPIGSREIQYLYALSLNPEARVLNKVQQLFLAQEKKNWQKRSVYLQLMIAATHYRMGDKDFALNTVLQSVLDRTVRDESLGMYWKEEPHYYSWYENPLRAQALGISLLTEIGTNDGHPEWKSYIPEMMRYLIGQRQVNRWPATTTTIDACIAMIKAAPENFTDSKRSVDVTLGNKKLDLKQQTGTGYMRYVVEGEDIEATMGKVTIDVKGTGGHNAVPVYGALYWQYVSEMGAVEASAKVPGFSLQKGLYREINTNGGKRLVAVEATEMLHVGDRLVSRLTVNLDRDMDYVHLREMRAAGVQPDQTISGYRFADGLSYYQTVGDFATDLYFDHISQGSFVIEYPVHVSHAGNFEAGTATIESFYAPAFATHTEGVRIRAEQQDQTL